MIGESGGIPGTQNFFPRIRYAKKEEKEKSRSVHLAFCLLSF
jgi:hypothetical protein